MVSYNTQSSILRKNKETYLGTKLQNGCDEGYKNKVDSKNKNETFLKKVKEIKRVFKNIRRRNVIGHVTGVVYRN